MIIPKKGEYYINIMYCGDNGITDGLIMSVLSLLNNTGNKQLNIYILTAQCSHKDKTYKPLSQNTVNALDELVKKSNRLNSVTLIDVTSLFAETPLSANLGTRFTPLCMLRLFADRIDGMPDKILYLDYDVVCKKDISRLYDTDIEGYELAGVLDRYGKWFFKRDPLKFNYINSGVLLLNMKNIRRSGLFEACRTRCAQKKMLMPDQSALNKLASNILLLPTEYNEQKKDRANTVLRHFTTFFKFFPYFRAVTVKPWHTDKMHGVLKTHEYDHLTHMLNDFKENLI